jgi:23S rRNA (uracil1939-C5)-methyltransferase
MTGGERAVPVSRGERLVLRPEALVAGGDAISRIDGFPIFTRAIYPGDAALVEIVEVKKGYARGELAEIVEPSPLRRAAPCPVAAECGGCDWTALRLDAQLEAKKAIVVESLRRVGKFDPAEIPPVRLHASPLNYRLRSRLHLTADGDDVGFYALRSTRVVPLAEECEVVGPGLLRNRSAVVRQLRRSGAGSVVTFESESGFTARPFTGEEDVGEEVAISVGEARYRLSTSSFFQVNRHLLSRLLDLVDVAAARAPRRRLAVDLYGGVGFFALRLARSFERVITVEASAVSHEYARLNALSAANVEADGRTVERFLRHAPDGIDFVMVDPPRAGLHVNVVDAIASSEASTICYLSCDPVTFSRDALRLRRDGWRPASLDLVDLFPNTHHIETLSSFVRDA